MHLLLQTYVVECTLSAAATNCAATLREAAVLAQTDDFPGIISWLVLAIEPANQKWGTALCNARDSNS